MKLMSEDVEQKIEQLGFTLEDIGNRRFEHEEYKPCNWWRLKYLLLDLSIYYDPIDALGSVGVPYYELYDGKDTFRYIENDNSYKDFVEFLNILMKDHQTELNEHPENFL